MTAEPDSRSAQEVWDSAAAAFDNEPDHGLLDPDVRAAWRSLLQRHIPSDPQDVLDVGCGTGSLSTLLAELGHRVTGVDLSPRMLELARAKSAAAGTNVAFVEGDASALAQAKGSVDIVLVRHLLWTMGDTRATLRYWRQRLRAGGRLLLIEGHWSTGAGIPARTCRAEVAEAFADVELVSLTDPTLWGGPTDDKRYLVVGRAT